ncbi:glycosyltransferase [Dyadobacter sp. LHD-138]|uniref:glycosyltransferase n=1 Tax=Dyadobacter sp. LHD-138 TaxID=3071413 RepID=UPI0027E0DE42|nr:glycosyltransferase [Dyadobacter sp. LHD-138]MDQ6481888.1 glycosyltransferase [Dyadobacter sp. LHD-138]
MEITAAIVTFKNDPTVLRAAIDSFLSCGLKICLYLIDNSPTDTLRHLISDSRVEYIFNNNNLGFGKAHNIGIAKSQSLNAKYHLVLNPDISFKPHTLEKIFEYMEAQQNLGLLMPKVTYPDGSLQYLCKHPPSISILLLRRFMPRAVQIFFQGKLNLYEYRDRDYNKIILDVPYLSGCFMFFRNTVLEKTGGFDEKIFMYMEDADITYRVLKYSHTIYYPEASIEHHFAKGSYKSLRLMYYNIQGAFIYFQKWGWRF